MRNLAIPKRSAACSEDQAEFVVSAEVITVLEKDDSDNFIRRDFCLPCWQKIKERFEGKTYWKSRIPPKTKKEKKLSPDQKALQLFKEWAQIEGEEGALKLHVLVLYMERRKQVEERRELQKEDRKARFFEVIQTGEILKIPKIKEIPLDELISIEKELLSGLNT